MAKLNWNRHIPKYTAPDYSDKNTYNARDVSQKLTANSQVWTLDDAWYGLSLHNVPLARLQYAGINCDVDSAQYKLAVLELQRRVIVQRRKQGK